MGKGLADWRVLTVAYVLVFGLWGFLAKIGTSHLNWQTVTLLVVITNTVVVVFLCLPGFQWSWSSTHGLCILAGLMAGVGSVLFYKALSIAPASRVIPISSQYILVTAALTVLFLHEPIRARILVGILFSALSVYLLVG